MTIHFVGAGPGAPDLITVRGRDLIARCPIVLFTGSLVPREVLAVASPEARVLDSKGMTLEEIVEILVEGHEAGHDVARVHTGDPFLFGAVAEQIRRLDELGIPWEIVPGVSSFSAAAAVLGKQLTLPEVAQTVILSRAEGRTPMPPGESLAELAVHRSTLCLFLSITLLEKVSRELIPSYGADCPVAVVYRASWPDEKVVESTLADIRRKVRAEKITRTALILVGRVLSPSAFRDSALYDANHVHVLRPHRRS